MQKMNVIAKISSYLERSVVTLKLRKEYLNTHYINLTLDKELNSLIYRTIFYVNIYGSYKLSKNSPVFLAHPVYPVIPLGLCVTHRSIHAKLHETNVVQQ